jgi:hypothetical protein
MLQIDPTPAMQAGLSAPQQIDRRFALDLVVLESLGLPHIPPGFDPDKPHLSFRMFTPSQIMTYYFKDRRSALRDLVHGFRFANDRQYLAIVWERSPEYLRQVDLFANKAEFLRPGNTLDSPIEPLAPKDWGNLSYLASPAGLSETEGAGRMRRHFAVGEGSELRTLCKEFLAAAVWRLTLPGQSTLVHRFKSG